MPYHYQTLNRLFYCLSLLSLCYSYHVGDPVETTLGGTSVLRSQMPKFGTPSRTTVMNPPTTVTLQFEGGMWVLPAHPMQKRNGEELHSVGVMFLWNDDGIQSVVSNPLYAPASRKSATDRTAILINYNWKKESELNVNAAVSVLYLITLLAGLWILLVVVCCPGGNSKSTATNGAPAGSSSSSSVPKWD